MTGGLWVEKVSPVREGGSDCKYVPLEEGLCMRLKSSGVSSVRKAGCKISI